MARGKKEVWYVAFGREGDMSSALIEATEEQAADIRDYLLAAAASYPDALREVSVSRADEDPLEAKWIWMDIHERFPNLKDAPRPRFRWRT